MSEPPRILAIDCATLPASVAVLSPAGVVCELTHDDEQRSDAWIGGALEQCLERAGLDVEELGGFAVSVGPGTFTGIRVGIATALGLAAPRRLPVAGVTTLDALAHIGLARAPVVASCIDARRSQVYAALYRRQPASERVQLAVSWGPAVCSPEEFATVIAQQDEAPLVLGSGAPLLAGATSAADAIPLATAVGTLALQGWPAGRAQPASWPPPEPVYLRPPDATPPRNPLLAPKA